MPKLETNKSIILESSLGSGAVICQICGAVGHFSEYGNLPHAVDCPNAGPFEYVNEADKISAVICPHWQGFCVRLKHDEGEAGKTLQIFSDIGNARSYAKNIAGFNEDYQLTHSPQSRSNNGHQRPNTRGDAGDYEGALGERARKFAFCR